MSLKLYYLDDEPALLELFVDCFGDEGFDIKTFLEPELLIAEIEKSPPDLLILDYRLPNTTGDKVAKLIGPNIPKILVTGDLEVKPEADFIRIFYKPYKASELLAFFNSRDFVSVA